MKANYRISEDGKNLVFAYKDKYIGIFVEAPENKIEALSRWAMVNAYCMRFIEMRANHSKP